MWVSTILEVFLHVGSTDYYGHHVLHGLCLGSKSVAFRFCTIAIRASSFVSLSNLFSASSISVLPISFFPYFSEYCSVNGDILIMNCSLVRPCPISSVATPRMERTSTIIRMIVCIISVVGGTSVYSSRRRKNISIRSKISIRVSWLARTSLAA
jgi:hypothetical protein